MEASEWTVVARIVARPGQVDALKALLAALVAPTRAEAGCIDYAFLQDAERPAHFVSIERWASAEAACSQPNEV